MSAGAQWAAHTRALNAPARVLGLAGLLFSGGAALWVGVEAWRHPLNTSRFDWYWLLAYAGLLAVSGALVGVGRGRWLLALVAVGTAALGLTSLLQPGAAWAYAVTALLLVVAGGLGGRVLRGLMPALRLSRLEHALLAEAVGLGALSMVTLALGLLGLLRPWLLLGLLAASLVWLGPGLWRAARAVYAAWRPLVGAAWRHGDLRGPALGAAVLAIALLGGLLWALAPSIHFDALVYHLGVPAIYVREQVIVEVPEEFRSYWAHNAEMLYTLALALAGQPAPGLLHLAAGGLTTGLVYAAGRRLADARVGLLAAALFYTLPLVTWLSGTANIDLLATLYAAGMVYAVLAWWQSADDAWLTLAGILAGLGLGAKLNVALTLLPLGLIVLAAVIARYRLSRRALAALLRFGLPALLLFTPWLVRDALWTGNPIFPYFNAVFHSPKWDTTNTFFNFATFGRGAGLLDFLRLPWDLSLHAGAFIEATPAGAVGALPLLALPWLYLRPAGGRRRVLWAAVLYCLAVAALWFRIGPYLRYLLPLFPVLAVLAALNLEQLWSGLAGQPWRRPAALVLVLAALAGAGATRVSHLRSLWQIPERYPHRLVLGQESTDAFLARSVSVYEALQFLNRQPVDGQKVLSIGNEYKLYADQRLYGLVGAVEARPLAGSELPGPALAKALHDHGYGYVLIDHNAIQLRPDHWPPFVTDAAFLSTYAQLEYARNEFYVYRLLLPARPPAAAPTNLLANGGFELAGPDGAAAGWDTLGSPLIDRSGAEALAGVVAVQPSGQDWFSQAVAVTPDQLYSLAHWTRAEAADQLARLQINWLGADGGLLGVSLVVEPVGSDWHWRQMSVTSPAGAARAQVYVNVHGASRVWVDDVTFVRGELPRPNR